MINIELKFIVDVGVSNKCQGHGVVDNLSQLGSKREKRLTDQAGLNRGIV